MDRWCRVKNGCGCYCFGVDFSIVCLKSSLLLLFGVPRTLVRGYFAWWEIEGTWPVQLLDMSLSITVAANTQGFRNLSINELCHMLLVISDIDRRV